jgi:adenylosuccinate lyase
MSAPSPFAALFTEDSIYQTWLDVEVALAAAQAELGIIPAPAAAEIAAKAKLDLVNRDDFAAHLETTGHALVSLVWQVDKLCENDAGGYLHWGATTVNITQTALLLLVRRAHRMIQRDLAELLRHLAGHADATRDYAMAGRTHGQPALPITFGFKVATWIDELLRHDERLRQLEPRTFRAMYGGGAGTLASLGDDGPAVQRGFAKQLDMAVMELPARTARDHLAEYVAALAMLSGTLARIAREVYTLMKVEYGEAEEAVPPGAVGSSTMPQKRNPKLCMRILELTPRARAQVAPALESLEADHEEDGSQCHVMEHAMTEAVTATGDALQATVALAAGLRVDRERMRRNLDLTHGLIVSERVMMVLGERIGRQLAHDAVYEAAQRAHQRGSAFADELLAEPEVAAHLTSEQIADLLDASRYTGLSAHFATQAAAAARAAADRTAPE